MDKHQHETMMDTLDKIHRETEGSRVDLGDLREELFAINKSILRGNELTERLIESQEYYLKRAEAGALDHHNFWKYSFLGMIIIISVYNLVTYLLDTLL